MKRAKFSTEVPVPHLMDFDDLQDYGYALSYLCDQPGYINYFRFVKASGREVILDNSYNELLRSEGLDRLFDIYDKMEPDYLISPDNKKVEDTTHYNTFDQVAQRIGFDKTIFVAFRISHYDFAIKNRLEHVAIAFPQRPAISNYFHAKGIPAWMQIHYLGLNHPSEFLQCDYIDTTLPLKLAYLHRSLSDWKREDYPHYSSHLVNKLFHKDILLDPIRPSYQATVRAATLKLKELQ